MLISSGGQSAHSQSSATSLDAPTTLGWGFFSSDRARSRVLSRVRAEGCGLRRLAPWHALGPVRSLVAILLSGLALCGGGKVRKGRERYRYKSTTYSRTDRASSFAALGGEGQTEPIGRHNRLTEPCVRRCAAACVPTPHHRQGSECHVQHREQQGPPAPVGPGSACRRDERRSWAACAEGPERSPKHAGAHGSGGGEGQLGAARLTTA